MCCLVVALVFVTIMVVALMISAAEFRQVRVGVVSQLFLAAFTADKDGVTFHVQLDRRAHRPQKFIANRTNLLLLGRSAVFCR